MKTNDGSLELEPGEWSIVPNDSDKIIKLALMLCTGIFAYHKKKQDAPYLIIHSGPIQGGGRPEVIMNEVMVKQEFADAPDKPYTESKSQISLQNIIEQYKKSVKGNSSMQDDNDILGIYIVSGSSIIPTDLAILRYFFVNKQNYDISGSKLNQMVWMNISPHKKTIELNDMAESQKIIATMQIGVKYQPAYQSKI